MDTTPQQPTAPEGHQRLIAAQHHDVVLEPGHAWCLKGAPHAAEEIVIPGLLLDDFGNCGNVEAALNHVIYMQMVAMAALEDSRMLIDRSGPAPRRTRPEANIWAVEGAVADGRIAVTAVTALDRVVVDGYGTHRVGTMLSSDLVPEAKAWP